MLSKMNYKCNLTYCFSPRLLSSISLHFNPRFLEISRVPSRVRALPRLVSHRAGADMIDRFRSSTPLFPAVEHRIPRSLGRRSLVSVPRIAALRVPLSSLLLGQSTRSSAHRRLFFPAARGRRVLHEWKTSVGREMNGSPDTLQNATPVSRYFERVLQFVRKISKLL